MRRAMVRRRRPQATAAAGSSIGGLPRRRCTRHPRCRTGRYVWRICHPLARRWSRRRPVRRRRYREGRAETPATRIPSAGACWVAMMRFGFPHLFGRAHAAAAWLTLVAFLGNALLPAGLAAAGLYHRSSNKPWLALCSAAPDRDLAGKARPALPLHHCALCVMPAAQPLPPAELAPPLGFARAPQSLLRRLSAIVPLRHGRVQARAPPFFA
jgi:hypothetical protein